MKYLFLILLVGIISCRDVHHHNYSTDPYVEPGQSCGYQNVVTTWSYPTNQFGFTINDELGFRVWISVDNSNSYVVDNINSSIGMQLRSVLWLNPCDLNWITVTAYNFFFERIVYKTCWGYQCSY